MRTSMGVACHRAWRVKGRGMTKGVACPRTWHAQERGMAMA